MRSAFRILPLTLAAAVSLATAKELRAAGPALQECVSANEASGPLRQSGRLREARANLLRCSAPTCPTLVRDDCIKGATELATSIPTIVFVAQDGAGNDLNDVSVAMDGQPLAAKLDGTALEIDPGEHSFRFEAPGVPAVEKRFVIREAEKDRRERVVLGEATPTAGPPSAPIVVTPPPAVPAAPANPPPPPPVHRETDSGTQRTVGLLVAGAGLAGVVVGGVFGLLAGSKWSQAQQDCGPACAVGSPAQGEAHDAHTDATVANVAFGLGGAALVVGTVVWLLAPPARSASGVHVAPFVVGSSGGGVMARTSLP